METCPGCFEPRETTLGTCPHCQTTRPVRFGFPGEDEHFRRLANVELVRLASKITHLENCFLAQSTCLMVAQHNAAERLRPYKELEQALRNAEHGILREHDPHCSSQIPNLRRPCDCGYEAIWSALEKLERQGK